MIYENITHNVRKELSVTGTRNSMRKWLHLLVWGQTKNINSSPQKMFNVLTDRISKAKSPYSQLRLCRVRELILTSFNVKLHAQG